jgi:hypothetical protein
VNQKETKIQPIVSNCLKKLERSIEHYEAAQRQCKLAFVRYQWVRRHQGVFDTPEEYDAFVDQRLRQNPVRKSDKERNGSDPVCV